MSEVINTEFLDRKISESSDTEYDPQFKPVVSLPEVEVSTNEENETALLKMRAKLYRFDRSSDPSEWKERGTGEVKILRHNENNAVRIVMRRDKTFKVCANHFITPWMTLQPCTGSEKAFLYTVAADFADEQPKSECLAIKFGNVENANSFKNKFEEAKKVVATECCLYNGEGDEENEEESDSDTEKDLSQGDSAAYEESEVTEKLSKLEVSNKLSDKNGE